MPRAHASCLAMLAPVTTMREGERIYSPGGRLLETGDPDDGSFGLSPPGTIAVSDDGRTQFTPGGAGKHRYVIVDPAQKAQLQSLYVALVSAPPAPRPGRRGGAPALEALELDDAMLD